VNQFDFKKLPGSALVLAAVMALSACGGGGSSGGSSGGSGSTAGASTGGTTGGATITAPTITTQPTATTITSSASGTLRVVASGTSPAYQWYSNSTAIGGATSASLTVTAAGNYYVVVTNSAGSVTSSTVAVVDTTPYAQQTAAAPFTFTGTSDGAVMESATYSYLNTVRVAANAGAVNAVATLNTAALAHSAYILANPSEFGHTEVSGHTGFTGVSANARIAAAGYTGSLWSEGVTGYAALAAPYASQCPQTLLNTLYHMASMLGPFRDLGIGYKTDGTGSGYCVMDYAYMTSAQYPAAGTVVTYPYAGQTDAAWAFQPAAESPRPPSTLTGTVGQPILASMGSLAVVTGDNSSKGTVTTFVLKDSSDNVIPAYVLAPSSITVASSITPLDDSANNVYYQPYDVFLVPQAALTPNTTYTVTFAGTYNGVAHAKTWSFTTTH